MMTLHTAWITPGRWQQTLDLPEPQYRPHRFTGAGAVPIFGWVAVPESPRGTVIATYGITGDLDNQAALRVLGRKAYAQGYAVVLFDWRAHGATAQLSPTLTSDGLYEGPDFVYLAAQAQALGCPPRFCFVGYSLGGQLALWGLKAAENPALREVAGLASTASVCAAVVCPNLDAWRSLNHLMAHPLGRYVERAIARSLKQLAEQIHQAHPGALDPAAIARADSIVAFDRELVIGPLGFDSVEDYYAATSPLGFLTALRSPHLMFYALDDPLFDPMIAHDLKHLASACPQLELRLTRYGGHVGYLSDAATQRQYGDRDAWWAWNRTLDWLGEQF